ncbi:MAG: AAA family ATPase [Crenarchaeota archaeon]|nr:AAA family ATPase [Thermoproteota archaeon]
MSETAVVLEIENFGPIKKGRVPLKNLTIIIGPSSSGKTYIAKLVYVLSRIVRYVLDYLDTKRFDIKTIENIDEKHYRELRDNIHSKIIKLLENEKVEIVIEKKIIDKIINLILKMISDIEGELTVYAENIIENVYETDTISLINSTSDKARIALALNDTKIIDIFLSREKDRPIKMVLNRELIERSIDTILVKKIIVLYCRDLKDIIGKLYMDDIDLLLDNLERSIENIIREKLKFLENSHIISIRSEIGRGKVEDITIILEDKDRYFIIFSSSTLDSNSINILLDDLLGFILGFSVKYFRDIIRKVTKKLENPIIVPGLRRTDILLKISLDKLEKFEKYGTRFIFSSEEEFKDIKKILDLPIYLTEYILTLSLSMVSNTRSELYEDLRRIEKLLFCGEINVKDKQIVFYDYRYNVTTSILSASASIQQLAGIFVIMKYRGKNVRCMIIEDPEIHCHASVQAFLALLLSMLSNRGNSIIVTTHSHYLVQRLYSLVMLSDLKHRNIKLYEKTIYKIVENWVNYLKSIGCILEKEALREILEKAIIDIGNVSLIIIRWCDELGGFYAQEYALLDRSMPSLSEVLDMLIIEDFLIEKSLEDLYRE